jgi:transposase
MPSPYSYDLRIGVIGAVEKGMEVSEASHPFGVHHQTITAWLTRKAATGDVRAKVGYPQGHSPKIPDPEQFKAFVQDHGEATLEELAEAWGGVKRMTIWRQLRKLGDTHNKRLFAIPSGTKS